ncbi:hypothetical protein SARC_02597 [Sphaeroforma arctica JP610]|uniref:Uncharacterized protein n=1 Tax=Sphaeroforma arctica JP610 TaxID=667725 RepID=A0A0L0G8L2_9EUKA|nr:hypothetical protein SARC_02597 [Sphaeroforma arctica JP610]KNC85221.1 hypothetical protein SARC_02597 [Sphaeroforma arctica JP610]|eukprot:XP_014159123.1 hypothetical protein SARC_02597 [Sphaeroforma arctica JP610]
MLVSPYQAFLGNAIAVTLHYLGVGPGACLWAYTVICVSLTRLGFSIIYEITSGMENTKHNNLHDVIAYYALPKAIMVVMCVSSLVRLAYLLIMRRKRVPRRSSSLHRSYQKEKDL